MRQSSAMKLTSLLVLPLLSGCAAGTVGGAADPGTLHGNPSDATLRVIAEPGVCWHANIEMTTKEGCGHASWEVSDGLGLFSSNVQKMTDKPGAITMTIEQDGQVVETNTTDAPYGVASVIFDGK
jgi:hypothetical protein